MDPCQQVAQASGSSTTSLYLASAGWAEPQRYEDTIWTDSCGLRRWLCMVQIHFNAPEYTPLRSQTCLSLNAAD